MDALEEINVFKICVSFTDFECLDARCMISSSHTHRRMKQKAVQILLEPFLSLNHFRNHIVDMEF